MLGGIVFQLCIIVFLSLCLIEYTVRYIRNNPIRKLGGDDTDRGLLTWRLKAMLGALAFSTFALFIR